MACYILCQDCGSVWDVKGSGTHNCGSDYGTQGSCENCDEWTSDAFWDGSRGITQHRNLFECIQRLRTQLRLLEQSALEHDSRYTDLEKAVAAITEGRRAAVEATKDRITISEEKSKVDE